MVPLTFTRQTAIELIADYQKPQKRIAMAKLKGLMAGLEGSLDILSFYKMKGVEDTVVRKKGGHTMEKIRKDPNLHQFRRASHEFGGCSTASKAIRNALLQQAIVADYNLSGPLLSRMAAVQKLDTEGEFDQRAIRLSLQPQLLKGFSFSKKTLFDSVVRCAVEARINKQAGTASIQLPELQTGFNFFPAESMPWFRLMVTFALVPDHYAYGDKEPLPPVLDEDGNMPRTAFDKVKYMVGNADYALVKGQHWDSPWYPVSAGAPANDLSLSLSIPPPDTDCTLLVAVGICYGQMKSPDKIQPIRSMGSAKILEVS